MTVFSPCRLCPYNSGCQRLADTKKALKGLMVTTARLACDIYRNAFDPGDRVEIIFRRERAMIGTVIGKSARKKDRTVVEIDDAYYDRLGVCAGSPDGEPFRETSHSFIAVPLKQIRAVDEPPRSICHKCGASIKADGKHESYLQEMNCKNWRA